MLLCKQRLWSFGHMGLSRTVEFRDIWAAFLTVCAYPVLSASLTLVKGMRCVHIEYQGGCQCLSVGQLVDWKLKCHPSLKVLVCLVKVCSGLANLMLMHCCKHMRFKGIFYRHQCPASPASFKLQGLLREFKNIRESSKSTMIARHASRAYRTIRDNLICTSYRRSCLCRSLSCCIPGMQHAKLWSGANS